MVDEHKGESPGETSICRRITLLHPLLLAASTCPWRIWIWIFRPQSARRNSAMLARKLRILPLGYDQEKLRVAMSAPNDNDTLHLVQFLSGRSLLIDVAKNCTLLRVPRRRSIFAMLEAAADTQADDPDRRELGTLSVAKPVVRLVTSIILEAARRNASDVRIRPSRRCRADLSNRWRFDPDTTLCPCIAACDRRTHQDIGNNGYHRT